MIRKETRDKLTAQSLQEITFARTHKQGKITNWHKNEDLYYGKKVKSEESRANVDLGLMQSFVHTLWSKVDNPLIFKYTKRKTSQYTRVKRLNALRAYDAQRDFWDLKDLVGKKQGIMYGRAIYAYYADSVDGEYKPHLEPVDVYDFLIDPSAGGIDIENGMYMGRYGITLTKAQLKQGLKDGIYIKTEVDELCRGGGNANEKTQEEVNKQNRVYDTNVVTANKEANTEEKFKFWEWYTTHDGTRYYLLMDNSGRAIRVEKLTDIFESNLFPFWTWAAFPDLTEFWTPSYCDYVREIFMAQAVSINQMLDNAEQINKPMKIIDTTAVSDLAQLKYRKDGNIFVNGNTAAVKYVETPSISTPLNVFDKLDAIQEKASGVTAAAKGIAEEDKVGIYEGNQANAADRFGLLNKSYSFGYQRFARLYEWGVKEHLKKKVGIDILGADGISLEEVSKRDIFWKNDTFGVMVEASNAEIAMSEVEKRTKLAFLSAQVGNPVQNPKKAYEIQANVAGFSDEEIRQLMDTQEFGDAELLAEADRDIEVLLDGKELSTNQHANVAYKQRFVDYMSDNLENMDDETYARFVAYVETLQPVIEKNVARQLADEQVKMMQQGVSSGVPLPDLGQNAGINLNQDINAEAQL